MSIHVMIPAVFQLSHESRLVAVRKRRMYLMYSEFTSATYLQSAITRDQPSTRRVPPCLRRLKPFIATARPVLSPALLTGFPSPRLTTVSRLDRDNQASALKPELEKHASIRPIPQSKAGVAQPAKRKVDDTFHDTPPPNINKTRRCPRDKNAHHEGLNWFCLCMSGVIVVNATRRRTTSRKPRVEKHRRVVAVVRSSSPHLVRSGSLLYPP